MAARNRLDQKAIRRRERASRKAKAAREIPFAGLMTTKRIVLGQRYNAVHGMDFSFSIAAVAIATSVRPKASLDPRPKRRR